MAISEKAVGTWAEFTADAAVTIPGSPAAGDRMFLFAAWKDFSVTAVVSGWTEVTEVADGSVSTGNGTGSMKCGAWYRDWQSGDGNPTLDITGAAALIGGAVISVLQKDAGETWDTPLTDTVALTSATNFSGTGAISFTTAEYKAGTLIYGLVGIRDDSATMTRSATAAISSSNGNVTWSANYVESPATHLSTTTGNDMSADLGYRMVSSASGSAQLTIAGTLSASETGNAIWVLQSVTAAAPDTRVPYYKPYTQLLAH